MIQKKIDIDKDESQYFVKKGENSVFYLFDNNKENKKQKITIHVEDASQLLVRCLIFAKQVHKSYYVKIIHHGNEARSEIETLCFASDKGKIVFECDSQNQRESYHNTLSQKLQGFLKNNDDSIRFLPALDINSMNVNASHTVSIGQIDPNIIFYFSTKGIQPSDSFVFLFQQYLKKFDYIFNTDKTMYLKLIKDIKTFMQNDGE